MNRLYLKLSHHNYVRIEKYSISDFNGHPKALGLEWNVGMDAFHITMSNLLPLDGVTKRTLVSDIAKIFDVLKWFPPAILSMKILLQRVWEVGVDWDDPVPAVIHDAWAQWSSELPITSLLFPQGNKDCVWEDSL